MIAFEIRPITMLRAIVALRWSQFRFAFTEWARAFGLVPSSGKWSERVNFIYIYVLSLVVLSPAIIQTLGGLYVAEAKTAPALQAIILQTTIPAILAVFSLIFIVMPWKAWLLRLTFGDITYLSASPFDRVVLSIWRYLEMILTVFALAILPLFVIAPMFGSIWADAVIANVLRGALAISLWSAPLLALGWHLSLQQYARKPLNSIYSMLARLLIIAGAVALWQLAPALLLLPGRLIVLTAMDRLPLALPALLTLTVVGIATVARAGQHLSLTRASAGSDVFARIQQLGIMVVVNPRLVTSIIGESRSNEGYAVGVLPPATGLNIIFARAALYYRRRLGQAIQLFAAGIGFGLLIMIWRPLDVVVAGLSVAVLILILPPWLARLFHNDVSVAFVSQFIPQSLTRRMLASTAVPVVLMLAGIVPTLLLFNDRLPSWAWGVVPAVWVLSLVGHVEVVERGSRPGERSAFSAIVGGVAVFAVIWSAITGSVPGIPALMQSSLLAGGVTFALLWYAEFRHNGMGI